MLERILKTLLIIMLMVFYTQKIVIPAVNDAVTARAELSRVKTALKEMASGEQSRISNILKTEKQMLTSHLNELERILPEFNSSRISAMTEIEGLREKFSGSWQIKPGSQPIAEENLVRWPVQIIYNGAFTTICQIVREIEFKKPLKRIVNLEVKKDKDANTVLNADIELLFRNTKQSAATNNGGLP